MSQMMPTHINLGHSFSQELMLAKTPVERGMDEFSGQIRYCSLGECARKNSKFRKLNHEENRVAFRQNMPIEPGAHVSTLAT
jgi:hypothetical protein